jgi:hypothetical protein
LVHSFFDFVHLSPIFSLLNILLFILFINYVTIRRDHCVIFEIPNVIFIFGGAPGGSWNAEAPAETKEPDESPEARHARLQADADAKIKAAYNDKWVKHKDGTMTLRGLVKPKKKAVADVPAEPPKKVRPRDRR